MPVSNYNHHYWNWNLLFLLRFFIGYWIKTELDFYPALFQPYKIELKKQASAFICNSFRWKFSGSSLCFFLTIIMLPFCHEQPFCNLCDYPYTQALQRPLRRVSWLTKEIVQGHLIREDNEWSNKLQKRTNLRLAESLGSCF